MNGGREQMTQALKRAGAHRFPVARPGYIVVTRNYLSEHCGMGLRSTLRKFSSPIERRDWLAQETRIKGLGYKEASHFLRNIGLKRYAILDKHVWRCLADLKLVAGPSPPLTRARYLETEERLRWFARDLAIDVDELDLVLWSMKTGEVLK
jgi:N-glycosylase/DNA lyase